MPLAVRLIDYERLKAPSASQGVLVEPELGRVLALLDSRGVYTSPPAKILEQDVNECRAALASELSLSRPVIATGHQAEFFHAGVFAKNIAAAEIAERFGPQAVFVMVDSDTPKSCGLEVPVIRSEEISRQASAIPNCRDELPTEAMPVGSAREWRGFLDELGAVSAAGRTDALAQYACGFLGDAGSIDFAESIAKGNQAIEAALGVRPLRVIRMAQLCGTSAFKAFAARCMLDARRMAEAYNTAQADYRARHRVRAPQRPVPPLESVEDRVELPFWLQREREPRRRVSIVSSGNEMRILAGQDPVALLSREELRAGAPASWPFERAGWRLRPRALALSAFMRLFLADIFIHGIGGAKYDEVTEGWIEHWLGIPVGPMMCVTSTLRLPLSRTCASSISPREARVVFRDARFNPQRHFELSPPQRQRFEQLVTAGQELKEDYRRPQGLATDRAELRAARRRNFNALKEWRQSVLATHAGELAQLETRIEAGQQHEAQGRIAEDREYFYALHTLADLREMSRLIREELS